MNGNHKQVSKLNSFQGVKLRGNETWTELLEIEKKEQDKKEQDKKEQLKLDNASIQRVDAQIKRKKIIKSKSPFINELERIFKR
tara:strand:- start:138 stop:389 length:252 start_codon:yes stop_codon:yes gene_type:complete